VMVKHLDASFFKRLVYNLCLPIGYRWADFKFDKQQPSLGWKILYWLAYVAMFRALRDRLGFSRVRSAMTGGAALGPDVFRFFHALGVNLKQIYGQTEIVGIAYMHRDGDVRPDTVGIPLPETECKISEQGEILSRSPSVCAGYYKMDDKSKELLEGGWLHSGDAGYIDENGHLVVEGPSDELLENPEVKKAYLGG